MPTFKKLIQEGTSGYAWPEYPTATQPNWSVIMTGAYPGTSGVYDMTIHVPGEPLDVVHTGFDSQYCKAEHLWQVVDRLGKQAFLFKYPGTWPPRLKHGYQIDGHCAPAGIVDHYWGSSAVAVHPSRIYSSENYTRSIKVEFRPQSDWANLPPSQSPALEEKISIAPGAGDVAFHLLLIDSQGKGYDHLLISPEKDAKKAVANLVPNEWSNMITAYFAGSRKKCQAAFRMKLIELSPDAKKIKLLCSQVYPTEGFSHPRSLEKKLVKECGPFIEYIGLQPYIFGWTNEETWVEEADYHTALMEKYASYVFKNHPWDFFAMQWHAIDFAKHQFWHFDPVGIYYDAKTAEKKWKIIETTYAMADRLVGTILKNATAETLVAVVSDHGHLPGVQEFLINNILINAGLVTLKTKRNERGEVETVREPDWSKTKAFAQYGWAVQIYVNLKGRDPDGIVEPGKGYEQVREEIIRLLYNTIDPKTGKHPVILALKREEAEPLLHCGPNAGDIIYILDPRYEASGTIRVPPVNYEKPRFASIHSSILPNARLGMGTIEAMYVFKGPGIRKGWRRPNPLRLVDIAPTISYAINIPAPAQSEGTVIYDLFSKAKF
ncbi:MAG: alkaline phosphatase family protein, partial [Deltaproteobacteria bacterium]|nr:alkaline phosphatase family protein [Deltaproteobacteria bacterium]